MGRLFWKFFLFIWLAQLAGMVGVGAVFWLEHRYPELHRGPPPGEFSPPPGLAGPSSPGGMPAFSGEHHPGEHHGPPHHESVFHIPLVPMLGAFFASFGCALGLAWYFAKPIRRLRNAFEAATEGNLEVRIGEAMGGRRDELADLGRDFDRMTARLESSMNLQRHLLHDVSHEMRSPLARLQAAIGLARQQPERTENSLERIERESERMNLLVGELLTLSRLDAGVTGVQENIDLQEMLANIADDARFEGMGRQVGVELAIDDLPEIRANAELLHRAIENVVRNALRYSPAGGLVRIEAGRLEGGIRLVVIDHGPGIPEQDLENIFKPFFRGEAAASESGYGLGLAITHRVVSSLHGRVWAENRNGGGLAVTVQFGMDL